MDFDAILDGQAVLDGLGHGVLIFDANGHLILNNRAAEAILGTDLKLIRAEGWTAAAVLLNSGQQDSRGQHRFGAAAHPEIQEAGAFSFLPGGRIYPLLGCHDPGP